MSHGAPPPAPGGHPVHRWLLRPHLFPRGEHSEGHYAARSVYGSILVLALLLALQQHPPGPFHAALLVAGTVLAVLGAEAYADLLGLEVDQGRPPTRAQRREKLHELGVVCAAGEGPVLIFVLSGLGLFDEERAFRIAIYLSITLLFLTGYATRRMAGRSVAASLRSALVVGGIGVALALFKHVAHG